MIEEIHANKKTIEQLIIERPIRFIKPSYISSIDDASIHLYAAAWWYDVVYKSKKYKLGDLIDQGYRVVNITKSFVSSDSNYQCFGYETAILEKEV